MKHNLTFLSTLLATTILAGNALAESCGEGCTYTLTTAEDGHTIAKIDDGVTSIPEESFKFKEDINELIIPDSVTYVGALAFAHMTNLTNLTLPNSAAYFESDAFWGATSLTSLTIPDSGITFESGAFYETGLTSKVVPPSTIFKGGQFRDMDNLNIVIEGDPSTIVDTHLDATNSNIYCTGPTCRLLEVMPWLYAGSGGTAIPFTKDENGVYDVGGTLYSSAADMGVSASCGDMATCLASISTHCSTSEECQTLLDMSSEGTNCNSVSSCKTYLSENSSGSDDASALAEKYHGTPLLYGKKIYTVQEAEEALGDGTKFHVGLTYK